jgi:hypothetical protein
MVHPKFIEFQTSLLGALSYNKENENSLSIGRPSIDWELPVENEVNFTKHAKGSGIQLSIGKNDSIVSFSFQQQNHIELALIRSYCKYYMKRAEDLPLIRKKPYKVTL